MTEAQVDPQTADVIEKLRGVTLANAMAMSEAAPIIETLTVVVTALANWKSLKMESDRRF